MANLEDRLVEALTRVDADGNDVHAAADVRHALPYLVIALDLDLDELSDPLQELVAEAMEAAGAMTAKDPIEALLAYFEKNPVTPAILDDVRRALSGDGLETGAHKAATMLGLDTKATAPPTERPKGTIPGAMARLQTAPPTKKTPG